LGGRDEGEMCKGIWNELVLCMGIWEGFSFCFFVRFGCYTMVGGLIGREGPRFRFIEQKFE